MTSKARLTTGRHGTFSGLPGLLCAFMIGLTAFFAAGSVAAAETRTLKLHFTHTGERAEIAFKRNGRFLSDGMQKINRFLRDWRRNEPTKMDPQLIDLIWEIYQKAGARDYIHVVSAYRSPATNSMLRKRSKGVAKKSQHMLGKAMDFYIPGVKLSKLRAVALQAQSGGVGYYPSSGSPFVHVDVGNVRHWPRMNRSQLMAVFPNGKTLHVPTDGKPLPGYEQALASYKSRRKTGAVAFASASGGSGRGFFSALFGGGADDEEDSVQMAAGMGVISPSNPSGTRGTRSQEVADESAAERLPGVAAPTMEAAREAPAAQPEPVADTPETIIAALPARAIPLPGAAPRPKVDVGPAAVAVETLEDKPALPVELQPVENTTAVAANVPLPSQRPDYTPAAQPASTEIAALLDKVAEEEAATVPAPTIALAPTPRPSDSSLAFAQVLAEAPMPGSRPSMTDAAQPEERQVLLAALPAESTISAKSARAAKPATPRGAMMASLAAGSAASALATTVKTTEKAARPTLSDLRPDPKAVVVPTEPAAARWAFQKDFIAEAGDQTTAPSFAYNVVRTAPRAVYTAGFQPADESRNAHRFSGKAVTFMSVAKFDTN